MRSVSTTELRELYQRFFESKKHVRIASAPLIPENDPSVLFTTAGMHPLVPYLKGQQHPLGTRLTNVQKCLRTTDIDEVGDATHATVFEMLGNWSLGDYFKEEAISWSWEFLTSDRWLSLSPELLAVSVFAGDADAPRDTVSARAWRALGVPESRIAYLGKDDNWWPAGGGSPGPQGPDTEMFYWTGTDAPPNQFDPTDKRWVEIWNDVFMEYNRTETGAYEALPQKNVDTGMGLERTVMVLNGLTSIYDIDSFQPLMALIHEHVRTSEVRSVRILADHVKAITFVLGDEVPVTPSNTDQGYVARRLIRRAVLAARTLDLSMDLPAFFARGVAIVIAEYSDCYPSLAARKEDALSALGEEIDQFSITLERGIKKMEEILQNRPGKDVTGLQAFELHATWGLPIDVQVELGQERGARVDVDGFREEMVKHQKLSRTSASGKFAGGLADHSAESIRYHTATHLLHQALQDVLGEHALQRGSNITTERLRFDFSHPVKMAPEELQRVEQIVNQKIAEDLPVSREEMTVVEAQRQGALGLFEHKYGDRVSVYRIGTFSTEICGGPHVAHTGELGHFRIVKEESASAGIRRIKAVLE